MNTTIRMATASDTQQLTRLRWKLITEDSDAPIDDNFNAVCNTWFKEIMVSSRWFVVVAASSISNLSGCMCLQIVDKAPDVDGLSSGWGYLTNCYVNKMERNNGVGRALIQKILLLGCQMDLELIIVWPSENSVRFYNRNGFQSVELAHSQQSDRPPLEYQICVLSA